MEIEAEKFFALTAKLAGFTPRIASTLYVAGEPASAGEGTGATTGGREARAGEGPDAATAAGQGADAGDPRARDANSPGRGGDACGGTVEGPA